MIHHQSKFVVTLILLVTLATCISAKVLEEDSNERMLTNGLVVSAQGFLEKWLVSHDIQAAMEYVSQKPVLGSCVRSLDTVGKKELTSAESRKAIHWILEKGAAVSPDVCRLRNIVKPLGITPEDAKNIAPDEPFELFALAHDYRDADFICKFDETPAFRTLFYRPDIYYLVFKILVPDRDDFWWIFAWRKEGDKWLIFSMGPLDD